MKLENIRVGQVFKNYGELCKALEIEEKTGRSKKFQIKKIKKYFRFSKIGQKITIDEIYETPVEKVIGKIENPNKNIRVKRTYEKGEASLNALYSVYRIQASKRHLSFELTRDQFKEITKKNCFYCGDEPHQKIKNKNGDYIYNGIDRVDNTKGYLIENVVPCCGICNKAKSNKTLEVFSIWINKVYKNIWVRE